MVAFREILISWISLNADKEEEQVHDLIRGVVELQRRLNTYPGSSPKPMSVPNWGEVGPSHLGWGYLGKYICEL